MFFIGSYPCLKPPAGYPSITPTMHCNYSHNALRLWVYDKRIPLMLTLPMRHCNCSHNALLLWEYDKPIPLMLTLPMMHCNSSQKAVLLWEYNKRIPLLLTLPMMHCNYSHNAILLSEWWTQNSDPYSKLSSSVSLRKWLYSQGNVWYCKWMPVESVWQIAGDTVLVLPAGGLGRIVRC